MFCIDRAELCLYIKKAVPSIIILALLLFCSLEKDLRYMGETAKKICLASLKSESNIVKSTELDLKLGLSNTYSVGNYDKNLIINASSTTPASSINFTTSQTSKIDLKVAKQKEDSKRLKRYIIKGKYFF